MRRLGQREMWAVFHADEVARTHPRPIAAFLSEEEAKGWVMLACRHIEPTPVVACVLLDGELVGMAGT